MLPESGVRVISGSQSDSDEEPWFTCLQPGKDENTINATINGVVRNIAAQCCRTDKATPEDSCKRYIGDVGNANTCVGGKPAKPFTYSENVALCERLSTEDMPLAVCNISCYQKGCASSLREFERV